MTFFNQLNAWLESKRLGRRYKELSAHQEISTVRYSSLKPPRVSGRSLTLFHRPKTMWFAVQIVFFAVLAAWTVKNYVHVLKNF